MQRVPAQANRSILQDEIKNLTFAVCIHSASASVCMSHATNAFMRAHKRKLGLLISDNATARRQSGNQIWSTECSRQASQTAKCHVFNLLPPCACLSFFSDAASCCWHCTALYVCREQIPIDCATEAFAKYGSSASKRVQVNFLIQSKRKKQYKQATKCI